MALVDTLWDAAREIGNGRTVRQLAREIRWAGNSVRCPCCGWRGRAFRPSCHDRPDVSSLCARCMSGPDDRAVCLTLRGLTSALPLGARILDVEPTRYTRQWFDRFNQFDYRTLGRRTSDVDIEGDLTDVKLPKGICHLVVCSQGVGPVNDTLAAALMLRRLANDNATVLVGNSRGPEYKNTADELRHHLEEAGLSVRADNLPQRLPPAVTARYGLEGATPFLVCAPT